MTIGTREAAQTMEDLDLVIGRAVRQVMKQNEGSFYIKEVADETLEGLPKLRKAIALHPLADMAVHQLFRRFVYNWVVGKKMIGRYRHNGVEIELPAFARLPSGRGGGFLWFRITELDQQGLTIWLLYLQGQVRSRQNTVNILSHLLTSIQGGQKVGDIIEEVSSNE